MDKQLYDALEVCMAAMRTGVDTNNCLALYPHIASELRAALEGAQYARALHITDVPMIPLRRSRIRLQKQAALLEDRKSWLSIPLQFPHTAFIVLLVFFVLALSWKSLLVVSAKSLPGDGLYPVKRAVESVALTFSPIVETRHEIENIYYLRRAEEIKTLFRLGRTEEISLEGVLTGVTATRMVVEDIPVVSDANTRIIGTLDPGMVVEVEGLTNPAGFIQAVEIHSASAGANSASETILQKSDSGE